MKSFKNKLKDVEKSVLRGNLCILDSILRKKDWEEILSNLPVHLRYRGIKPECYRQEVMEQFTQLTSKFTSRELHIIKKITEVSKKSNLYSKIIKEESRGVVKNYIKKEIVNEGDFEKLSHKKDVFRKSNYVY